jgi:hypothetical protein
MHRPIYSIILVCTRVAFIDEVLSFFLGTDTREFDELYACGTKRMRPVDRTFGIRNTARDFIQEVRGGDGAIERCYKVGRESIKRPGE